jgi:hypothetical protein
MTLRPMAITPAAAAASGPTLLHGAGRAPPLCLSGTGRHPIRPRAQLMANFAPPLVGADGSNVELGARMAPAAYLDEAGACQSELPCAVMHTTSRDSLYEAEQGETKRLAPPSSSLARLGGRMCVALVLWQCSHGFCTTAGIAPSCCLAHPEHQR